MNTTLFDDKRVFLLKNNENGLNVEFRGLENLSQATERLNIQWKTTLNGTQYANVVLLYFEIVGETIYYYELFNAEIRYVNDNNFTIKFYFINHTAEFLDPIHKKSVAGFAIDLLKGLHKNPQELEINVGEMGKVKVITYHWIMAEIDNGDKFKKVKEWQLKED